MDLDTFEEMVETVPLLALCGYRSRAWDAAELALGPAAQEHKVSFWSLRNHCTGSSSVRISPSAFQEEPRFLFDASAQVNGFGTWHTTEITEM